MRTACREGRASPARCRWIPRGCTRFRVRSRFPRAGRLPGSRAASHAALRRYKFLWPSYLSARRILAGACGKVGWRRDERGREGNGEGMTGETLVCRSRASRRAAANQEVRPRKAGRTQQSKWLILLQKVCGQPEPDRPEGRKERGRFAAATAQTYRAESRASYCPMLRARSVQLMRCRRCRRVRPAATSAPWGDRLSRFCVLMNPIPPRLAIPSEPGRRIAC